MNDLLSLLHTQRLQALRADLYNNHPLYNPAEYYKHYCNQLHQLALQADYRPCVPPPAPWTEGWRESQNEWAKIP